MIRDIKELYEYREMVRCLVRRELRGKYKGSVLGFFWSLLVPLFQLLVYTVAFSVFMKSEIENFSMFLFTALIPWLFFSSCISAGAVSVVQQKNLVGKVYFPRTVLPVSAAAGCFINMLLSLSVVFPALLISGTGISVRVLWCLPPVLLIEFFMGAGAALLFSALTVYFRDLEYILNIVTMAWMYMTPVLYPLDAVPDAARSFLYLNPMTSVITACRDILYYQRMPEPQTLFYAAAWGAVLSAAGWAVFGRLQGNFVEEL